MRILGLTGSIGMGKSATAALFRSCGTPVFDADAAVHALYKGAAVAAVASAFPGVVVDGRVDRALLAAGILDAPDALARLEAIVHPLVRTMEAAFLEKAWSGGHRLAVLDIPLLLEGGGYRRVDVIAVVTATADIQRARVLARPGTTEAKFHALLARQMPDAQKRRRAHLLIDTGPGLDAAARQVRQIVATFA